jgi:hypothetical protein
MECFYCAELARNPGEGSFLSDPSFFAPAPAPRWLGLVAETESFGSRSTVALLAEMLFGEDKS